MTANETLDTVLKFIYNIKYTEFTEDDGRAIKLTRLYELMAKEGVEALLDDREFHVYNIQELEEIIEKLSEDGIVKIVYYKMAPTRIYKTFKGRWFANNPNSGGYSAQERKEANRNKIRNLERILLTFGAVATGVYGIFEIARWLLNGYRFLFSIQIITAFMIFSFGVIGGLMISLIIKHQLNLKNQI